MGRAAVSANRKASRLCVFMLSIFWGRFCFINEKQSSHPELHGCYTLAFVFLPRSSNAFCPSSPRSSTPKNTSACLEQKFNLPPPRFQQKGGVCSTFPATHPHLGERKSGQSPNQGTVEERRKGKSMPLGLATRSSALSHILAHFSITAHP